MTVGDVGATLAFRVTYLLPLLVVMAPACVSHVPGKTFLLLVSLAFRITYIFWSPSPG